MEEISRTQVLTTPILTTKLFIPFPRTKVVHRPRLIKQLNNGLLQYGSFGRKLTLLSAPAGFGKTTLISEWVAELSRQIPNRPDGCDPSQPEIRIAWLSVDEGDNDPASFLKYLVAAVQTISKDFGEGLLGAIQSSQSLTPIPESLLANLLNEMGAIPEKFILVLDDYHVIDSEPIDRAITFLLDHLPLQTHLVITTREDPSLPLSRYRARGQMTELRAADLRFTPEEAGAFLNQMMNLNLSPEDIAALETRTEGWIAGLQLAALSMQGRDDYSSFIKAFTGSHRFILDYLVEEVLRHQSEPVRQFLLETAILDQFCAPLCNAVTGRIDGKEMLDLLDRINLFLIPLDDTRQWYRYHHLFAEVLQAHVTETLPGQLPALHSQASLWYEENGLPTEAIRHALIAKDFERAAGLIELAWPATEDKSIQPATWFGWVKKLPEELIHVRPVLNIGYAYALLANGEMEAAQARLTEVENLLDKPMENIVVADQEQFKSLPATIAISRAYIAQAHGNNQDTVRYARQVLELMPEGDHFRRVQAALMLGMTYWAGGDLKAAERIFSEYTLKIRNAGNIPDAIATTVVLAEMRSALGHLQEAIRSIEHLIQFILDQVKPIPPDAADLYRGLSELNLDQGDLEAAAQHLQRSEELGAKADLPVWRYRWHIAQARLTEMQGDLDGALALLDEAERLYIRTPLPDIRPISAMKARIWIDQGRLIQALEWVRERGFSPDDDLSYLNEFEYITLARTRIAQYQNDQNEETIQAVMRLLDRLLQAAEDGCRMSSVIEIQILRAVAYQAQGNITPALVMLVRALTLAEPEGYVRVFVGEGKPITELLKRLAAKNETPGLKQHIHKLVSAFEQQKEKSPSGGKSKPSISAQPLIEPLSERELEVLRLLRTDLSGPEITRELTVSLSTLRTHTQRIYAKLGVNNRRAAVHRAEELKLV